MLTITYSTLVISNDWCFSQKTLQSLCATSFLNIMLLLLNMNLPLSNLSSDRLLYLRTQGGSARSSGCCWGHDRSQYHLETVQREAMTESTFKKVTALTVYKDRQHKCSLKLKLSYPSLLVLSSQTATGRTLAEPNNVFAPCSSFFKPLF